MEVASRRRGSIAPRRAEKNTTRMEVTARKGETEDDDIVMAGSHALVKGGA